MEMDNNITIICNSTSNNNENKSNNTNTVQNLDIFGILGVEDISITYRVIKRKRIKNVRDRKYGLQVCPSIGGNFSNDSRHLLETLKSLNHQNILKVYDIWCEVPQNDWEISYIFNNQGLQMYSFALIELYDLNLESWINSPHNYNASLNEKRSIFIQIVEGLCSAHEKGVFHGHLTPSKVFLKKQPQILGYMVKISFDVFRNEICDKDNDILSLGLIFLKMLNSPSDKNDNSSPAQLQLEKLYLEAELITYILETTPTIFEIQKWIYQNYYNFEIKSKFYLDGLIHLFQGFNQSHSFLTEIKFTNISLTLDFLAKNLLKIHTQFLKSFIIENIELLESSKKSSTVETIVKMPNLTKFVFHHVESELLERTVQNLELISNIFLFPVKFDNCSPSVDVFGDIWKCSQLEEVSIAIGNFKILEINRGYRQFLMKNLTDTLRISNEIEILNLQNTSIESIEAIYLSILNLSNVDLSSQCLNSIFKVAVNLQEFYLNPKIHQKFSISHLPRNSMRKLSIGNCTLENELDYFNIQTPIPLDSVTFINCKIPADLFDNFSKLFNPKELGYFGEIQIDRNLVHFDSILTQTRVQLVYIEYFDNKLLKSDILDGAISMENNNPTDTNNTNINNLKFEKSFDWETPADKIWTRSHLNSDEMDHIRSILDGTLIFNLDRYVV